MVLKIITVLLLSIFFLVTNPIFADSNVKINEFYALGGASSDPDWVELYNMSDSQEVIDSWVLRDSTDTNKLILTGSICPHSFRKFNFLNRLNNSGDKIRLLQSDSSQSPIDEITYFSDEVPSHLKNQSTSRIPDGADSWTVLTNSSPSDNTTCNQSSPDPTPDQTTDTSPTASQTTNSLTPKIQSPATVKLVSKSSTPQSKPSPAVLGEGTQSASPSAQPKSPIPSSTPVNNPNNQNPQNTKVAYYMTGLGTILIACSLIYYFLINKRSKSKENKDDQDSHN